MKVRAFITHKLKEKYKNCQDYFSINKEEKRIAVSDGMSESIFPQFWAKILSDWYVGNGTCSKEDVPALCESWKCKVQDFIEESRKNNTLHWRTESSFLEGKSAGATICGITFCDSTKWVSHVLGDTCVVKISKDNTIESIYSSEDKPFDCYPDFYDSNPKTQGRGSIRKIEGEINEGEKLLLVSDPFSEYFYNNYNTSEEMLSDISAIDSHASFCSFVDKWRMNGMHNDDSTLVIVEWDGSVEFNVVHEDDLCLLVKEENVIQEEHNDLQNKCISMNILFHEQTSSCETNLKDKEIENEKGIELLEQIQQEETNEERTNIPNLNGLDDVKYVTQTDIDKLTKLLLEEMLKFIPNRKHKKDDKKKNIQKSISIVLKNYFINFYD